MATKKDIPPSRYQKVYVMDGVTYLPHYNAKWYVAPGYGKQNNRLYTASELELANAKAEHIMLWNRSEF